MQTPYMWYPSTLNEARRCVMNGAICAIDASTHTKGSLAAISTERNSGCLDTVLVQEPRLENIGRRGTLTGDYPQHF